MDCRGSIPSRPAPAIRRVADRLTADQRDRPPRGFTFRTAPARAIYRASRAVVRLASVGVNRSDRRNTAPKRSQAHQPGRLMVTGRALWACSTSLLTLRPTVAPRRGPFLSAGLKSPLSTSPAPTLAVIKSGKRNDSYRPDKKFLRRSTVLMAMLRFARRLIERRR
jgi:hypothetical protein